MTFRPGELDQLITITRESEGDDDMGGQDVIPVPVATDIWAKARPLTGREFERYDQVNATAMVAFVIRYRSGIRANDRIEWNGEKYNIRYIPPVTGRALYMVIEAEKGVAQ